MRKNLFITLSIVLSFSLVLSGCNLLSPPAVPTLDPQAQQATIDAAVAAVMQTAVVNNTSTALAMPTSTVTLTPVPPTATATLAPTATKWVPTATIKPTYPTKTLLPHRRIIAAK